MTNTKQTTTMNTKGTTAIILLSGGLDCICALSQCINLYDIKAITFDYGQKAFEQELKATKNICKYYDLQQEIIELDWLKKIINQEKSDWIPNRNSIFINIAAAYLDAQHGGKIIIGANKEEAGDFPDNSAEFIEKTNQTLKYSCKQPVEVVAPLIDLYKKEIVALALKNKAPLKYIYSCYAGNDKHCGICGSCKLLKQALLQNNCTDIVEFSED